MLRNKSPEQLPLLSVLRAFLRKLLIFASIQAGLLALIVYFGYRPGAVHMDVTRLKHQLLENQPSPRLILVGGSNLSFGIDSELLQSETGYHPVNMGLLGGFGLAYMLNEVEAGARSGDLVVVAVEYHNFFTMGAMAEGLMGLLETVEQRPANLSYLERCHWKAIGDLGGLPYLGSVTRQGLLVLGGKKGGFPSAMATRYNQWGDEVAHRTRGPKPLPRPSGPIRLNPEAVLRINRLYASLQRRGARLVVSYPPFPSTEYVRVGRQIQRLHQQLTSELLCPVLGTPEQMLFPLDDFQGHVHHLWGSAILERTRRLAALVNAYRDESPRAP